MMKRKPMPKTANLNGREVPVNWGFRTGIMMDIAYYNETEPLEERFMEMMNLYYGNIQNIRESELKTAVDKMLYHYTRGGYDQDEKETEQKKQSRQRNREFCFVQDEDLIIAAFLQNYNMFITRMQDEELHWWEFMQLFAGLPEETTIKKYIYYRTVDIASLPKEEAKQIKKIRMQIKVRSAQSKGKSAQEKLEERNRRWLDAARNIENEFRNNTNT